MCEGWRLIIWLVSVPRWVLIIMYTEYTPVIIMLIPIRIMVKFDQENNDMVMNNSPIRLIEGGRARLARLAISHHVAISGKTI